MIAIVVLELTLYMTFYAIKLYYRLAFVDLTISSFITK